MRGGKTYYCLLLILFILFSMMGCSNTSGAGVPQGTAAGDNNDPPDIFQQEMLTDSGTYTGRIDDLSIEVMISGVPEDNAYRAFELSDALRTSFDSYGFEAGDPVIFDYEPSETVSRPVIFEIEKIDNNQ